MGKKSIDGKPGGPSGMVLMGENMFCMGAIDGIDEGRIWKAC